ncbi:MAG TPA: T9SS type A sorting domain-containing protein [Bacteroidia bacterium]|jgi:photosystem II stability/assembly factor-like uncharacterized protein|nr:T9SS type A sorting domain-containing protein [Bacteroidia bacterium]
MKRLLLLSVLFLLISIKLFAQYNWVVYPNTPSTPNRFDDVYFINPNQGWLVDPIEGFGNYAKVYETRNGGVSWQLVQDSINAYLRSVGFIDSIHGFIGNLADTTAAPDKVPMYYTNDGGKTLTPVNFPVPRPGGICGISVVTDSVVYAYGRYYGPSVLAKTTDAGKTWKTYDMSPYASVGLIDGWFWSKDTGFVTGQNGSNSVILHTVDGGASWQTVYAATRNDTDHVWKIFFPSRNVGYGSIEYTGHFNEYPGSYNTYFVKTTDGGKTWAEHPFVPSYDEEGCGFINDTVGWIGGWTGLSYKTMNGGNSWNIDSSFGISSIPKTQPLPYINRFRKFGDSLFYASGNTIYKLMLYKPDTMTQHTAPIVINNSFTNFPNPYNTQTTILYTIPRSSSYVTFEVYDAIGRKLFTQNLGAQMAGTHQMTYSQPLTPGEYTYTIITDNFKGTRKMEVTK